jgi:hypothetical protein
MSSETMPQKSSTLKKALNIVLILINLNGAFATYSMYSFDDLQIHERLVIIIGCILLLLIMIIKEFLVKPLQKRVYFNLFIMSGYILIYIYMYLVW